MRLSRIEIENFKGIGTAQVIDLKPITLLFGPNSAGKTTVLQALHYVREVLERQNPDPDQTIAGGLTDLGGFASLVHNHDLANTIRLKLTLDLDEDLGADHLPLNSGSEWNNPEFSDLRVWYAKGGSSAEREDGFVRTMAVELSVAWSELLACPYVSAVEIEMDGKRIASLLSPPEVGRTQLTNVNFGHRLLQEVINPEDMDPDEVAKWAEVTPEEYESEATFDPFSSPVGAALWEFSREIAADRSQSEPNSTVRVAVHTKLGALPDLDTELLLDLTDLPKEVRTDEAQRELKLRVGLMRLLDEMILGPLRLVRDHLKATTYIGPLREVPERTYRPVRSPNESRWAQGLAAWDLLYADRSEKLLDSVNTWLGGADKLNTCYNLVRRETKEIPGDSRFNIIFQNGISEDNIAELQDLYSSLASTTAVSLWDFERNVSLTPKDVGVGISQMIPVVVACLKSGGGILAVEQPELHIHPAIQVGMGDLFIHASQPDDENFGSRKTLLIETHSEHLILRLLRRIRETTEGELPPGVLGLSPESLSVLYVDMTTDGPQFRSLRVDKYGEFIDRWPKGFFDERAEELF
jgi:hypothetical protein